MQIRPFFGNAMMPKAQNAPTVASRPAAPTEARDMVRFGRDLSPSEQTIELTRTLDKMLFALTPIAERQQRFIDYAANKIQIAQIEKDYERQKSLLKELLEQGDALVNGKETGKLSLKTKKSKGSLEDGGMHVEINLNGEQLYLLLNDDDRVVSIENSNPNTSKEPFHGLVGWMRFLDGTVLSGSRFSTQILSTSDAEALEKAEHLRKALSARVQELIAEE